MNPSQIRANEDQDFAAGTWGGEFHPEFGPREGDVIVLDRTGISIRENYTNVKNAVKTGINRPVIAAGMVEENHTMTTMKLNTAQFKQIDKSQFAKAPEFAQSSGYINTPNNNSPITLSSLKGKVVLVYVWTYTCINSIRPMPYIDNWNEKYSDKGLVIVKVIYKIFLG